MPIISFSDINRELMGEPINNGEALELIKIEREAVYSDFKDAISKDTSLSIIQESLRLTMAYDILIETFEQYLSHDK